MSSSGRSIHEDSLEQKTLNLSALEARRDAKRRQVEALQLEMTAIQRQMQGIKTELASLDQQIAAEEAALQNEQQAIDVNDDDRRRISYGQEEVVVEEEGHDGVFQVTDEETPSARDTPVGGQSVLTNNADELLTDPMTFTMNPDEHLTEPTTQGDDDMEARDIENFYDENVPSPMPPRFSSNSGIGPLQITRGHSLTTAGGASSSRIRESRPATVTSGTTLHHAAAATAAAAPTSSHKPKSNATLDQYFGRTHVTPTSSTEAQAHGVLSPTARGSGNHPRDSLQSLPPQPPSDSNNNGYTVASIPTSEDRSHPYLEQLKSNNFPWSQQVYDALHNVFGIQSFREQQKEIINCTMNGDDAFVIMRTGGGKSLTYQLPALLEGCGPEKKITIVVSPLLSLIRDQEEQMNAYSPGNAISFTSNLPGGNTEHARRWGLVRDRNSGVCLVFVTPEKVNKSGKLKSELQKLDEQGRLGRFVIDECHCACQWGHDFRPDYTKLGVLKTLFPNIPLIAVTATASDRVRLDCCNILRLGRNYQFFRSTADRPNLCYSVRTKVDGKDKVVDEMAAFIKEKHPRNAGIIYTFSKKDADDVAGKLCDRGIVARSYHSSVNDSAKEHTHRSWMRNETQVVVATIAFGLGINKPDVRFVFHHSPSKSLEAYYQESGRAGRDGEPADCVLFYSAKDVARVIGLIHGQNGEGSFWSMVRYAQASGNDAVCRSIILSTLGEPGSQDSDVVLEQNDGKVTEKRDVGKHAKTVTELLQYKMMRGEDVTIPQLVKEWKTKSENAPECVQKNPPGKDLTTNECERIIIALMIEDIIHPKVSFNSYGTTMYLKLGTRAHLLLASPDPQVPVRFPIRKPRAAAKKSDPKKSRRAVPDEDGWISAKKKPAKRKRRSSAAKSKPNTKRDSKAGGQKSKKKTEVVAEVIELSSDDSSVAPPIPPQRNTVARAAGKESSQQRDICLDAPGSDVSEYEFD